MDRYGDVPIIYTRLGVVCDALIEASTKYLPSFTREQFVELTGLGESSVRDKLRDMEKYGLVQKDKKTYTITKRGLDIVNGGPERKSAMRECINLEPLWVELTKTIGETPDRDTFDKTIRGYKESYSKFSKEILNNIWSAYVSDLSCLKKSPPFKEKISDFIKRKPGFHTDSSAPSTISTPQSDEVNHEPVIQTQILEANMETPAEKPQPDENISNVSQDLLGLAEYLPSDVQVSMIFGKVKFELRDSSSIALAKALINVKEKGIQRGSDYEQTKR